MNAQRAERVRPMQAWAQERKLLEETDGWKYQDLLEEAWEKFAPQDWITNPKRWFHHNVLRTPTLPVPFLLENYRHVPSQWSVLVGVLADPKATETAEQLRVELLLRASKLQTPHLGPIRVHFEQGKSAPEPRWAEREVRQYKGGMDLPLAAFHNLRRAFRLDGTPQGAQLAMHVVAASNKNLNGPPLLTTDFEVLECRHLATVWERNFGSESNVFQVLSELYDLGFGIQDLEDFGGLYAPLQVFVPKEELDHE